MKTCPVCKAITFDDAPVCYGCLYRYEGDDLAGVTDVPDGPTALSEALAAPCALPEAPGFLIRMVPVFEQSGGYAWKCSVTCEGK